MSGSAGSPAYLVQHIRNALATDHRVLEQGLEVTVVGETILVRGTVATPAERDAVDVVVHELAPEAEIVNDVEVPPNAEPDGAEEIG
jgi:hypothetical protein